MSDQEALNTILRSLAPYRVDETGVALTKTILGRGGFGVVLLGKIGPSVGNPKSSMLVAVKQLLATGTLEENKRLALALVKELQVWAGLAHPNVIPLVGFLLDEGLEKAWFVSPYMKNGNIRRYLNQHMPDMIVRLRMWGQVARGVFCLHRRNLCHGDIKGANVLVDDNGQAKICDFGLTKLMENGTAGGTSSTGLKGTIRYMAPELFLEGSTRDKQSDVWAWSCLGVEVLFDEVPHASVNIEPAIMLRIMQGGLPLDINTIVVEDDIKQLFKSCWVADPNDRIEMKACVTTVESAVEGMRPGVGLDETTSDYIAVLPTSDEAIDSPKIHASSLNVEKMHSAPSRSSDDEVRGADFDIVPASWETPIEDEPGIDRGQIRVQGHLELDHALQNLSSSALDKCRKNGEVAELEVAINMFRQTLPLRPQGHPGRDFIINNLAVLLMAKYGKNSNIADLEEAVDLYRQVLLLRPTGHPGRDVAFKDLTRVLMDKYGKNANVVDLEEAIGLYRQVLPLQPQGHPEQHASLYHLASALEQKYRGGNNVADLEEAIDLYRQVLLLRPQRHPGRGEALQNLVRVLMDKYRKNSNIADLEEAIGLSRQVLLRRSERHPGRAIALKDLAELLMNRYRKNADIADLKGAINLYRQVLLLRPQGHPGRDIALEDLVRALMGKLNAGIKHQEVDPVEHVRQLLRNHPRREREKRAADQEEVIDLYRQILLLRPQGHPARDVAIKELTKSLLDERREKDDITKLEEVIDVYRQILLLLPQGHPGRDIALKDLVKVIMDRVNAGIKHQGVGYARREEGAADPEKVIGLYRQVLLLQPQGHPGRDVALEDLTKWLLDRRRKVGGNRQMEEVIDVYRQILLLRPQGHPGRDIALNGLVSSLIHKAEYYTNIADLEEAIGLSRQVLLLQPPGHPEQDASLYHLASALEKRSYREKNVADLEEAVDLYRQVLLLRPTGHPGRDVALHNLVRVLMNKYDKNANIADLKEAIDLYRQSLLLTPHGSRGWGSALTGLAASLDERYRLQNNVADLDEIIDLYRQGLQLQLWSKTFAFGNLARSLHARYRRQNNVADLDEAITLFKQELAWMSVDDDGSQEKKDFLRALRAERSTIRWKSNPIGNFFR